MIFNIQSSADIHTQNLLKTIMFIIERKQTHRRELSQSLSLSAGAVSSLCNKLVSLGLVSEYKQSGQSHGAKIKILSMSRGPYCLAMLDIHQRKTAHFYILYLDGAVLSSVSFAIADTIEEFVTDFEQVYLLEMEKLPQKTTISMGVAVSATMHKKSGLLVSAADPVFEEFPLKNILERICRIPVTIENDSVICSIASIIRNRASPQSSIYIFIEEGLGIGIVIQNMLINGDNGLGSEVSNILCPYTQTTIEQALSCESKEGQRVKAKTLGYLLSILVNLFDINTFYIGGYLAEQLADLSVELNLVLDELVLHQELRDIQVIPDISYAETMKYGILTVVMPRAISWLEQIPVAQV